jgi:predicted NUDIX family NTP pyrophosphohydrolase
LRSGHVSRQNVTLAFGTTAELNLASHREPELSLEWP